MDDQISFREYTIGSCFGQIELLLNLPRLYSVKALEDSHLMLIERADVTSAIKVFPELKIDLLISGLIKLMRTKQTLHKVDLRLKLDIRSPLDPPRRRLLVC